MYKVLALCLLVVTTAYGQNHFIDDCLTPGPKPTLLFDQEVSKSGGLLQVQEQTVRIPASGFAPSPITCITVRNKQSDAIGGYPSIESGGVGQNYVNIHLKSQLNQGFDFQISVYYNAA